MANPWIIEAKVVATTLASAGIGTTIAVLNDVENDSNLLNPLPHVVQGVVLIAIPTVVAFLAGWRAKHTSRPDLAE